MFGLLPDLTPRDSHSIWYTSSRNPITQAALLEAHEHNNHHGSAQQQQQQQQQNSSSSRRAGQLLIERSALARLRADEHTMDRRRLHVQNFGSTWLKPPGVPKTLHQIREERREQEEHAEAMRREQLALELAEAEAGGQDDDGGLGVLGEGEDGEQEEEARDLDDEIPDAAEESFGFDGGEDSMADDLSSSEGRPLSLDDNDDEETEEEEDDDDEDDDDATAVDEDEYERRDGLVAARMRMADDAFRQALARGDVDGDDMYGAEEELEASGQGQMLDEEDLLEDGFAAEGVVDDDDLGMGVDMDADLDDEIPEAEGLSGVYEHTDSEAEVSGLTSSVISSGGEEDDEEDDDEEGDISFAPRAAPLRAPLSPTGDRGRGSAAGAARHHHHMPRSSLDLSGLLSADGSSMMDSSPNMRAHRR
ncbi:hypothetical protein CLIM01_09269 [Colletotrichum limetticola]|uniref:Replicase polyprotein 1a n=1 Tax=Colletotrichum limetticola TaxID=1209924 RepID=A0ABQ9PPE6_9PEZI|nr:hypothetical protein CLIM01_09269 [Colletotrichum limetticola]